jgi:hypothetical protein
MPREAAESCCTLRHTAWPGCPLHRHRRGPSRSSRRLCQLRLPLIRLRQLPLQSSRQPRRQSIRLRQLRRQSIRPRQLRRQSIRLRQLRLQPIPLRRCRR